MCATEVPVPGLVRLKSSCAGNQLSDNNNSSPAGRQAQRAEMEKKIRSSFLNLYRNSELKPKSAGCPILESLFDSRVGIQKTPPKNTKTASATGLNRGLMGIA